MRALIDPHIDPHGDWQKELNYQRQRNLLPEELTILVVGHVTNGRAPRPRSSAPGKTISCMPYEKTA